VRIFLDLNLKRAYLLIKIFFDVDQTEKKGKKNPGDWRSTSMLEEVEEHLKDFIQSKCKQN